jgi:hypothetical protein
VTALDPATAPTAELSRVDPAGGPATGNRKRARITARSFRSRRSILATIAAVVLAVVALLALVEVVSRLIDRPARAVPVSRLIELGRETQWDDPLALIVSGVLAAIGLLLVLMAIWPGHGGVVPLAVDDPALVAGVSRRALRHDAATAAREVPGVTGATAKLRGRRLRVRARTPLRDPRELAAEVEQAVSARIERLAPLRPIRVTAAVQRARGGGLGG